MSILNFDNKAGWNELRELLIPADIEKLIVDDSYRLSLLGYKNNLSMIYAIRMINCP